MKISGTITVQWDKKTETLAQFQEKYYKFKAHILKLQSFGQLPIELEVRPRASEPVVQMTALMSTEARQVPAHPPTPRTKSSIVTAMELYSRSRKRQDEVRQLRSSERHEQVVL